MIEEEVAQHPWNPDGRPWAAQVAHLMRDHAAAPAWVEDHVARFPADRQILENVLRNLDRPGFALPEGIAPATSTQP